MVSACFMSCSKDDEEKPNTNTEYKNADLIGWWTTPKDEGYGSYYRNAIHFIDDQVVEFGVIFITGSDYATTINGEKYYWGSDYKETTAYERDGNVIKVFNGFHPITIVNGKLNFEYWAGKTINYSKTATTN